MADKPPHLYHNGVPNVRLATVATLRQLGDKSNSMTTHQIYAAIKELLPGWPLVLANFMTGVIRLEQEGLVVRYRDEHKHIIGHDLMDHEAYADEVAKILGGSFKMPSNKVRVRRSSQSQPVRPEPPVQVRPTDELDQTINSIAFKMVLNRLRQIEADL